MVVFVHTVLLLYWFLYPVSCMLYFVCCILHAVCFLTQFRSRRRPDLEL